MRVIATPAYDRQASRLLTAAERAEAEAMIAARPEGWPVIPGTGGARKARVARGNRGKSGGARVIYFVRTGAGAIYLLTIYAKGAKENLTHADQNAIRRLIVEAGPEPQAEA